jgi:hypothetical protein
MQRRTRGIGTSHVYLLFNLIVYMYVLNLLNAISSLSEDCTKMKTLY